MAKFSVVRVPNLGALLKVDSGISKEAAEAVGDAASLPVMEVVRQTAHTHYSNMIAEIGRKLGGSGMPLPTAGGSRTLSFGLPSGAVTRITTESWAPLTEKYRRRAPKSFKFWHKEGRLYGAYQTQVRGTGDVDIQELKARRNHHKGRVNVSYLLQFSELPFPFNNAIAKPFMAQVRGVGIRDYTQPTDYEGNVTGIALRSGLGRAIFPESSPKGSRMRRPFLRQAASAMGRFVRKDISSKLRKI